MPIDVRSCVHVWVPTAHCPPDHIAERAVESMLSATTATRTHTRSPPSPGRTHAHAPSHGPNFDARSTRPSSRGVKFSTFSDPPNLYGGGWPSPGFAVLQLVLVWAGQEGGGQEGGGREEGGRGGGEGPFLPTLNGCGLRRTASDTCSCVDYQQRFHSHTSALCRTPAMRLCVRARNGGAMGATACAFALL